MIINLKLQFKFLLISISLLALTNFDFANARHVFPCFDEPEFKADYEISILSPKGYNSLSNMPVMQEATENDP